MGGACQGLEDAGFPVHLAVNHDEIAIAAHRALNPFTKHLQADIYEVDPLEATGGRHVGNLWGSPDCTDHSVAKGGAPRSPRVRSMPWQLCRWVGVLRKRDRKGNIVIGPDGKPEMVTRPLTKTEAMRLVGNSVPKRMAMLLAQTNAVHALNAPSRHMQVAE
ncbi:DNA cytosine methyltransferase [Azospirillum sp. Vi22]|nr:DNA cytosine methyltransferase [Azospirillum baldaniorum]